MKRIILLAIGIFIMMPMMSQIRLNFGRDNKALKLQIAEQAINSLYVDSVDETKLIEDGIRGMLEKLDPHSQYSTPKEVKELTEPLQGDSEGVCVVPASIHLQPNTQ